MNARVITPPPYRSPEWQEWRRHGLGASEIAAVHGLDPRTTPYQLAARKRGLAEPQAETDAMRWGSRIEGVALDMYQEMQGVEVVRGETWEHDRWPTCWATLDGRHGRVGVEVKATQRWRTPPLHVQVQVQTQMGIAELERVDVVRVTPYGVPEITPIERDEQTIVQLLDGAEEWAARYIHGDEMPPLDGSPEARVVLDRLRGDGEMSATAEQEALARALRDVQAQAKTLEDREGHIKAAIKASMAGYGRLVGDGWHMTWAVVAARRMVAWRPLAEALRQHVRPGEWDELVAAATTLSEPHTQLRPYWEDEG